jgi:hypothetical protein
MWVAMVTNKGQSNAVKEKARCALGERFRWKLTMVRPYLSWDTDGGNWALAWDIGSLETSIYLMLLLDVHGGEPFAPASDAGPCFSAPRAARASALPDALTRTKSGASEPNESARRLC